MHAGMTPDHIDTSKESYLLVCWRSRTIIVANGRILMVAKASRDITWHEGWYEQQVKNNMELDKGEASGGGREGVKDPKGSE